jgi:hypothetical protein
MNGGTSRASRTSRTSRTHWRVPCEKSGSRLPILPVSRPNLRDAGAGKFGSGGGEKICEQPHGPRHRRKTWESQASTTVRGEDVRRHTVPAPSLTQPNALPAAARGPRAAARTETTLRVTGLPKPLRNVDGFAGSCGPLASRRQLHDEQISKGGSSDP